MIVSFWRNAFQQKKQKHQRSFRSAGMFISCSVDGHVSKTFENFSRIQMAINGTTWAVQMANFAQCPGLAEAEQLCMLQQSALDRISHWAMTRHGGQSQSCSVRGMDFQHLKAATQREPILWWVYVMGLLWFNGLPWYCQISYPYHIYIYIIQHNST